LKRSLALILLFVLAAAAAPAAEAVDQIPLTVESHRPGAPLTVGIPFPKGALASPDDVRLLNAQGEEIPAQVTQVTTWAPADPGSVKWIWVFFFAGEGDDYTLEHGPDVERAPLEGPRIRLRNDMRAGEGVTVNTGPLRFRVDQGEGGFLSEVTLDTDGSGRLDDDEVVATGPGARGSFLDLLDEAGIDSSRAVVRRTWIEKGSGPLHTIVRVEGTYRYDRSDNNPAPFTTRIHAYAGKSYVRVLHTFTYTGDPSERPPLDGQHALIATQTDDIVDEDSLAQDKRVTEPEDRIASSGLALKYDLGSGDDASLRYATGYREGPRRQPGASETYETALGAAERVAVTQRGPGATGQLPPGDAQQPNSSATEHLEEGFSATVRAGGDTPVEAARAEGWMDVRGDRAGVGVGMRHFFKAYPAALALHSADSTVSADIWPSQVEPMSFARRSTEKDGGMVGNFAQGLAKTAELVYDFHRPDKRTEAVARTLGHVLEPPVAHAPPAWYAQSKVYGSMAPYSPSQAEYERGLTYKFDWWLFNQAWEPWYGTFDYGDGKTYYFNDQWYLWTNNEPATDYMWWLEFMRTGERDYYLTAQATSRHTMDVDNTHWPAPREYIGDSNASLTALEAAADSARGAPYRGMGRRHGRQQWTAMLSAHVWVPGWIASYYLSGYHRGLEVAKQTADYYARRIFGKHGLTGRRLYLSVWNLAEVWDATKNERYGRELKDRIDRMLKLQPEQGGNLLIDRYGYAQVYVSHGLGKYLRMTGSSDTLHTEARRAMVRHARHVRDVPPRNHEMESYLSTIHSLLLGYKLSGEESLYRTARERAQVLRTDELPSDDAFQEYDQQELAEALTTVSHLPDGREPRPPIWKITNGLRVFGWTHAYNVPYLIYWLKRDGQRAEAHGPEQSGNAIPAEDRSER
jgi:hypothetical protein